jgi:hypothetical protein
VTDLKVVPFVREGWRDAIKTLRLIADELEASDDPECVVGALVLVDRDSQPRTYGFGPQGEDMNVLAALELGKIAISDHILGRS